MAKLMSYSGIVISTTVLYADYRPKKGICRKIRVLRTTTCGGFEDVAFKTIIRAKQSQRE